MYWNGQAWTVIPSPSFSLSYVLCSICVVTFTNEMLVGILGLRARLEAFDRRIAREVIDDARAREEHEQYVLYFC